MANSVKVGRFKVNRAGMARLVNDPSTTTYRQMARIGSTVQSVAAQLAPVDTGRLRQSGSVEMRGRYPRLAARIRFSARYARWVHEGRGPIVPRRKKFLAWKDKSGKWIFAKRVRAMKGRPFLTRAAELVTGKKPSGGK
ncbi:hypothetical protein [Amycolatopsis sp. DSM 110486]|uniref:hypothetical protein n=1 Tax=Amycolatopsis sp. DSM 110486 TaxID=2865832 RepID=UPI001C697739|nr:hypothetical protein [Amycolatopsis sp. DSM 110486]QYN17611.1 hypothetical protein K1T34_33030 [Amycolatopsis sp. DSM 110486]